MIEQFKYAYIVRQKFIELVNSLSLEQLNAIPKGYNNNILWHFGHLVVSTQLLCYVRSGVRLEREIEFADKYKNGSKPEGFVHQDELDFLKSKIVASIMDIEKDYQNGIFKEMKPYATHTFGIELSSIEDVFECCSFHDTVHWGNALAMKRLVSEN